MLDQNTFMETIKAVSEIMRTSPKPLGREEILSYFKEMELNENQENMVLEFLLTPHEAVTDEPETEGEEAPEAGLEESENGKADNEQIKEPAEEPDCIPDSPMFQMYLEELSDIPEYSKEQMNEMYAKLLDGDESMIHAISNAWLRNVLEIAKKLAVFSEGFEDVVQEGNMGLFLCLSDLCGSKEQTDVEKELLLAVEESMKDCIRELTGEDESENAMVGKISLVSEAVKYLKEEKGHEPSIKELSDYTSVSEDELSDILDLIDKAKKKDN